MAEAVGLIGAALIAGVVSFLSLVISKEQSISDFRQQWIDALRKDIAIIVGRVTAIHAESISKHKDDQEKLWAKVKPDFIGLQRVIVRIRLRLNPDEKRAKEGLATKAVLDILGTLKSVFDSPKPAFHELDGLVNALVSNSQVILKENWDRVREGEDTYQKAKSWSVIAIKLSIAIGVISVIGYGLYRVNAIHPVTLKFTSMYNFANPEEKSRTMVWLALLVSLVGGGLAGGIVSTLYNRSLRHRILRTELYAKINNMHSAYLIRFTETPQGRGTVLVRIVGQEPQGADREFIEHRTAFIQGLVGYNELEEARKLRQAILDNETREHKTPGVMSKLDLQPESEALIVCIKKLHDDLELDKR